MSSRAGAAVPPPHLPPGHVSSLILSCVLGVESGFTHSYRYTHDLQRAAQFSSRASAPTSPPPTCPHCSARPRNARRRFCPVWKVGCSVHAAPQRLIEVHDTLLNSVQICIIYQSSLTALAVLVLSLCSRRHARSRWLAHAGAPIPPLVCSAREAPLPVGCTSRRARIRSGSWISSRPRRAPPAAVAPPLVGDDGGAPGA